MLDLVLKVVLPVDGEKDDNDFFVDVCDDADVFTLPKGELLGLFVFCEEYGGLLPSNNVGASWVAAGWVAAGVTTGAGVTASVAAGIAGWTTVDWVAAGARLANFVAILSSKLAARLATFASILLSIFVISSINLLFASTA